MDTNTEEKKTLIFGLSPKATIINALALLTLAQFIWGLVVVNQYKMHHEISVPWYTDIPLTVLSIFMTLRWVDYRFKLNTEGLDHKSFRVRLVAMLTLFLIGYILKLSFALTLFSLL